ncbi:MAG TPA: methyltransferase domain-containing protein [Gemmatimonadales bacterium]|nr:methyltransferase domain-containing protein [Gemmatimonadales bacterium]
MSANELQRQVDGATAFESLFVPALFQEWAPRVCSAAKLRAGDRVLDVACGTGVVAREAAERVGPAGSVTGLDLNPGMLAVAKRLRPDIVWRQGDAGSLPFADDAFDAVVSQFGLMFFADRVGAIREMVRVLTPGGRLAVAVWDSLDRTPAYAAEVALLERMAGPAAADALRFPFCLGDTGQLAGLFSAAGLPDAVITSHMGTGRFPSIRTMIEADLRGWLPLVGITLEDELLERILAEAETALAPYRLANGTVAFESPAHIVSAG